MSEAVLEAVESSLATTLGESFSGVVPIEPTPTEEAPVSATLVDEELQFDFEADFQSKIAAFAVRDVEFFRHCGHLLQPQFFENAGEATLVKLVLEHAKKYQGVPPDATTLNKLIMDGLRDKTISKDVGREVVVAKKILGEIALLDRGYTEDTVARFAKHQAIGLAMVKSLTHRDRGEFDKIEILMASAISIGINADADGYDFFARGQERADERLDMVSGKKRPTGITTGIPQMDALLYHKGWGRKELSSIMGGAKAGKTTALINFAKAASMAKHDVLYVTLEVGKGVVSDRLEASITETLMKELTSNIHHIREKIETINKTAGRLIIHEYASGTFSPNMLRKLIDRYKSVGRNPDGSERAPIKFDLVVVDYADIMAPNYRTEDAIENSKTVYIDLRAIAFDEDVAMLTATQTNRAGYVATVAKAEHVAEDFNKIRTVDLMISINKTEEEAKRNEARLYFAASRNQESGFTVLIKQNLAMMVFVEAVLGVE